MKKLISILCISLMITSLVACGNNKETDDSSTQETEVVSESIPEKITPTDIEAIHEDDYIKATIKGNLIIESKIDKPWEWSNLDDIAEITLEDGKYIISPLKAGNVTFEFLSDVADYEIDYFVYDDMTILASIRENIPIAEEPIDIEDSDIADILNTIYDNMPENSVPTPRITTQIPIDNIEMLSYHFGVESLDGAEVAYVSEPMMSSIAYTVGVIRFSDDTNMDIVAKTIKENAPISKWVCVEAEKVETKVINNYIVLIMADTKTVDLISETIDANF